MRSESFAKWVDVCLEHVRPRRLVKLLTRSEWEQVIESMNPEPAVWYDLTVIPHAVYGDPNRYVLTGELKIDRETPPSGLSLIHI